MELSPLYHLHPIFEFFLTSFFALIVAPKFLTEFLEEKMPDYSDKNKERILISLKSRLNYWERVRANFNRSPIKNHSAGIPISNIFKGYIDPLEELIKKTMETVDAETKITHAKFIKNFKKSFNCLLIYAGFFNFIILLMNGCEWDENKFNTTNVAYGLFVYSLFTIVFYFVLYYKNWLLSFIKIEFGKFHFGNYLQGVPFHFLHALVFMGISIFISFFYISNMLELKWWIIDHIPNFENITYVTVVFAGGIILIFYSLKLVSNSKRPFETVYAREIYEVRKKQKSVTKLYKKKMKIWLKHYKEMQSE